MDADAAACRAGKRAKAASRGMAEQHDRAR